MEILRFGLGLRFYLPGLTEEERCIRAFEILFSSVNARDVEGLLLYGGVFSLDVGDSDEIYTVVFTNGGLKKMRKLFRKLSSDAYLSKRLATDRPFIQTNTLYRAEGLTYFGRFDSAGSLLQGEKELPVSVNDNKASKNTFNRELKIVLAPDKFKGSLSAEEVTSILSASARRVFPYCTVVSIPIADGGDGTMLALTRASGGVRRHATVTSPYGNKVEAEYGVINGNTAVIEMAQASGLTVAKKLGEPADPLLATSRGTGELIARVLNEGIRNIMIGIGGSATNDGGMGAACALGVKFFDSDDKELSGIGADMIKVNRMDASAIHPDIKSANITVMCDVNNPMTGENGATAVYAAQKGADSSAKESLEEGMKNLSHIYDSYAERDVCSLPGSGAAGGMGAMLCAVLHANCVSGAEAVFEAVKFDELISNANLIVTGEGRLDASSADYGKAVGTVVCHATKQNIPVFAVVGSLGDGYRRVFELGDVGICTCIGDAMDEESAMKNAALLLDEAAERMFRGISATMRMG